MLCLAQRSNVGRRLFAFASLSMRPIMNICRGEDLHHAHTPITLQMRPQRFRSLGAGVLLFIFPFSLCDVFTLLCFVLMTVLISRDTHVGHASVENLTSSTAKKSIDYSVILCLTHLFVLFSFTGLATE